MTDQTVKERITALAYLEKVNKMSKLINGPDLNLHIDNSWDGDYFDYITKTLQEAGWEECDSHSQCSVAHKETNYCKGTISMNIIVSVLFGVFTQITVTRK